MIFRVPSLAATDRAVVSQVEAVRKDLAHILSAPRRWTGVLRRSTLGRVIRGSNSIEGYVIPKDDVVAAALGGPVSANETTRQATETYRRAMTHVLGLSKDKHFEWSAAVIKSLHYIMLEYDLDKMPGQWRPGPVVVFDEERNITVYEGPDADVVPALMAEFVESLRTPTDGIPDLVLAAMAHLNLAMIHPFKDGNGRMARAIQTLVLGRAGKLEPLFSSIEEYLGTNTRPYYDVLAGVGKGSWHPEHNALPWVRFCLRAHYYQAHTYLRRTRESESLMNALEELVVSKGLPERTRLALWDAAQGFRVRNSTYRSAAEVEEQTASRDLLELVRARLLLPQGEKKGRSYVASSILADIRRSIAEDRLIPDPYDEWKSIPTTMETITSAGAVSIKTSIPSSGGATGPLPPSLPSRHGGRNPDEKP